MLHYSTVYFLHGVGKIILQQYILLIIFQLVLNMTTIYQGRILERTLQNTVHILQITWAGFRTISELYIIQLGSLIIRCDFSSGLFNQRTSESK